MKLVKVSNDLVVDIDSIKMLRKNTLNATIYFKDEEQVRTITTEHYDSLIEYLGVNRLNNLCYNSFHVTNLTGETGNEHGDPINGVIT